MGVVMDYLFKLGYFAAILLFILFSITWRSGKDYGGRYLFFCYFRPVNVLSGWMFLQYF